MAMRIFLFGGFALGTRPLLPLTDALQQAGWQVVLQDLPDVVPDADFARAWQAEYDVGHSDVLAGWSLGGQVAVRLAQHLACRVVTLASNPCFCAVNDGTAGMKAADFAHFVAQQKQSPAENWRQFVRLCAYGERDVALQRQVKVWQAMWCDDMLAQQARLMMHLQWLQDWNVLPILQSLTAGQLHILAGNDALMNGFEVANALPVRDDVWVNVLAGASHLLVWSRVAEIVAQINDFVCKTG